MDGLKAMATEGGQLGGTTVIVQYVERHPSGYGDKFGGDTPMSDTRRQRKAVVLRNGQAYNGALVAAEKAARSSRRGRWAAGRLPARGRPDLGAADRKKTAKP